MLSEQQIAETLERALAGARKVVRDQRGWSVVSQQEIIAMAMMIDLIFGDRDDPHVRE